MRPSCGTLLEMVFAAKCYWPGITPQELAHAAARATLEAERSTRHGRALTYLGSILFPDDELVLCLFDGHSPAAVRNANERAGIPCERIMHSICLAPEPAPERPQNVEQPEMNEETR